MVRACIVVPLLAVVAGCEETVIPNTEVPDTAENREIIRYCEEYRIALEARDVVALLSMAADDYYEDAGTPTGQDDYDRGGLEAVLRTRFARVEAVRYDILYRRIVVLADRVEVYFTFYGRFQVSSEEEGGEARWFSKVGDNRLVLARTPDGFRILSGL
jgi:hypothetical protein